jgi:cytochrome oxidase Cu insertion factor (SCO1/SenC/PrrC family)
MKILFITHCLAALMCAMQTHAAQLEPNGTAAPPYQAPEPGSYNLPVIKRAADGLLLNSEAKPVRLRDLTRGRITVLSFIYTRCTTAEACPAATGVLRELHALSAGDPLLRDNLRLVSMSFDPGFDTPKTMAAYSALAEGRPNAAEWHFVTARSAAELTPILEGYGQTVDRKADPSSPGGPLNHVLRVYLIDGQGRIRNIYSSGTLDVRLVVADIKTLLMEAKPLSAVN